METNITKLIYLNERIFYDPERRAREEKLQNAIERGTEIVVSGYCICDLDGTRLKQLLGRSQTRLVGLRDIPNCCSSRKFIEKCGKTWVEAILPDEQYAAIGGMTHEEYQEAWRKKREIEREISEAENEGKAKVYQRLLERL